MTLASAPSTLHREDATATAAPEVFAVHTSRVGDYKTCPRLEKYSWRMRLASKTPSVKLSLGTGVHKALAAYYRDNVDPVAVFLTWAQEERERVLPNTLPEYLEKFDKAVELGRKLLTAYVPWADEHDNFEVLHVEQPFEIPILDPRSNAPLLVLGESGRMIPAVHRGTIDGIVRDAYGRLWLLEHKTRLSFPSDIELRMDDQSGMYILAANELFPDLRVGGVLFNVLRKVDPTRARTDVFKRFPIRKNAHELARLLERRYIDTVRMAAEQFHAPTPGMHCNWKCAFKDLCTAEEDGSDFETLMDVGYTLRPEWLEDEEEEGES